MAMGVFAALAVFGTLAEDKPSSDKTSPDDFEDWECPADEREMREIFDKRDYCLFMKDEVSCGYNFRYWYRWGFLECLPRTIYTCTYDLEGPDWFYWKKKEPSTPDCAYHGYPSWCPNSFGKECDPSVCPFVEPPNDVSCEWIYKDDTQCEYQAKWSGCNLNDITCKNTVKYACKLFETELKGWTARRYRWVGRTIAEPECTEVQNLPFGESCKINDVYEPPPPIDPPPCEIDPEDGSDCNANKPCIGNYKYQGCPKLSCEPSARYNCLEGKWSVTHFPPEEPCPDDEDNFPGQNNTDRNKSCNFRDCPPAEAPDVKQIFAKPVEGGQCTTERMKKCFYPSKNCDPLPGYIPISYFRCMPQSGTWRGKWQESCPEVP